MTAPGITPGDWGADGGRQPQIYSEADPKGRTLALVYDLEDAAETAANAEAIAALPALIKACQRFARWYEQTFDPEIQGIASDISNALEEAGAYPVPEARAAEDEAYVERARKLREKDEPCTCEEPDRMTCGGCGRSWCDRCDPERGCHYCCGRGYSTGALDAEL